MDFEEFALYSMKILGFILIAVGVGSMVWSGWSVNVTHLLMVILGILFSGGGFFFGARDAPSELELQRLREREIEEMYVPPVYREFDRKKAGYEAAHRLGDNNVNVGDFSGFKGH